MQKESIFVISVEKNQLIEMYLGHSQTCQVLGILRDLFHAF